MSGWRGRPLVLEAIEKEKINALAAQLETAPETDTTFDEVRAACAQGNLRILKMILERGGARFLKNEDRETGRTLLHEAADRGHTPVCKRLIDLGVDPSKRAGGLTAAELATKNGFPETATVISSMMTGGAGPAAPPTAAPKSAPASTSASAAPPPPAPALGKQGGPPLPPKQPGGPPLPPKGPANAAPTSPSPAADVPYAGPNCVRGHPTQIYTAHPYNCDRCGSTHFDKYALLTRHRCTQCGYDMCAQCAPLPPNWEKLVVKAPPPPSAASAPRQKPLPPPAPTDANAAARPIVVLKPRNDYAPGFHQHARCQTSGCKGYVMIAKDVGKCKRCQETDAEPFTRMECLARCGFSVCAKCDAAVRSECYLCEYCLVWYSADNMHRHLQQGCAQHKCPVSACGLVFPSRRARDEHMWSACIDAAANAWIKRDEARIVEEAAQAAAAAEASHYSAPSHSSSARGGACRSCNGAGGAACTGCKGGYWGPKGTNVHNGCKGTGYVKCSRCGGSGKG